MKSLVILAAGMGSRYGGLKQLDGFGPQGETILEYSIYDAIRAGFEKVIFVIRKDFQDQFTTQLINPLRTRHPNTEFVLVYQGMDSYLPDGFDPSHRTKPWGTAHAVLVAKPEIDGPFCVINADDRYGPGAYQKIHTYFDTTLTPSRLSMVGYVLENTLSPYGTVNRGVCQVNGGALQSVHEHLKIQKEEGCGSAIDMYENQLDLHSIVSMNFWGFDASHIEVFETLFHEFLIEYPDDPTREFFITTVVDHLVHTMGYTCDVLTTNDPWCGVTYQDDKPFVQEVIQQAIDAGVYPTTGL